MAFYIFPRAVSKSDCKVLLDYCVNNVKLEDATTIVSGSPDTINRASDNYEESIKKDHDSRKTSVGFLGAENNDLNELVWGFLRRANAEFFKYKLDFFQPIQFAKYQDGGHYAWHQDSTGQELNTECRKLSLTFSLTDHNNYDGGLLQFYNGERPYEDKDHDVETDIKTVGTVIVFDSRDWHRVTPVTEGIRYSIVCWTVGPNFV